MIGGLKKTASILAITASAGLLSTAAFAADLGGNCCADLEERVAELEATTARKGNRVVSLTVSGHVHEAIVFWDVDGAGANNGSNVYIGTHNSSRSRFRFRGSAKINSEWSAGFLIEIGVRANHLGNNSQTSVLNTSGLDIRHEALYIDSKRLGRVWLGWTSSATDGITEICLGCGIGNQSLLSDDMGDMLAGGGIRFDRHNGQSGDFVGEGDRRSIIRYISPAMYGFTVSSAYGQDEFWDVALRYANEFNGVRLAAGIGYSSKQGRDNGAGFVQEADCTFTRGGEKDCETLGASLSIYHVPTGLYLTGAYGQTNDNLAPANADTNTNWMITGGVNKKWSPLGATNIWVKYHHGEREIGQRSELDIYGVGIQQDIDAAAMSLYLHWFHHDATLNGRDNGEMDQVVAGALIRF
jgi:predicted porin